ncbi:MAG: Eco57I restriction-modification methylase domain-containing protein [Armatimonadetes bacterium]|nr:Eco57I restriction-modification methylase domain-containing protein [Armatimonadota bacterium]
MRNSYGLGAFFLAAKTMTEEMGKTVSLLGCEIDPGALQVARCNGLSEADLANVEIRDFVLTPPNGRFQAIVANPPYIRHHRLSPDTKTQLKTLAAKMIGRPLDGRAGYHIYFLLRALELLCADGRLAFIMPADTCEGVFAPDLWRWIGSNYRIEAVVTFSPDASPFPDVDTNPIIFMIRNTKPEQHLHWAKCVTAGSEAAEKWISSGFQQCEQGDLSVCSRHLSEALVSGLSRSPRSVERDGPLLGDFARVMRGIATGANDFFFMTRSRASSLGIPREFLIPAVGRTRDVNGGEITDSTIAELERRGRPTMLLCVNGCALDDLPASVRSYIEHGKAAGLDKKPLISTRRPWYKMESRDVPPILFAYLGRRDARFVRNTAGVVPLTGFLCVYPLRNTAGYVEKLWKVLSHPDTVANLSLVGKSYGSGAIKVEPRALERLPLPKEAVVEAGIEEEASSAQLTLTSLR